jgi:multiple sugar transport system substrate-binding protein
MKISKWTAFITSALIGVMLVGTLLTGCGAKEEKNESKGDDKTTITMAWWGSQVRHDATVEVIEMYEKANPNIDIEYEFFDWDGYNTKLNTLAASKSVWDVFQIADQFPSFIDSIEPLDSYIEKGLIDTSNTTDAYLATTSLDGVQVGISNGMAPYGIAYDPAIFKKAGLEEPTEAWTWDDFEKDCLTIHEKLGIYGFSNMDDFKPGATAGIYQYGDGQNFYDKATDSKSLGFKDPSLLEPYFVMRQKLVEAGAYPDPGAIAEIKDIEGDYVVTEEAAMTWVASNQLTALADAAGREIKLITLPRREADLPSTTLRSSQMLCMAKNSKVKDEAAKFISFFENNLEANRILNAERGVPIMSNVREDLQSSASGATLELFSYIENVGKIDDGNGNSVECPSNAVIEDQYKLLMQKVIYGELTPKDASKEIYDFAEDKLSEYK